MKYDNKYNGYFENGKFISMKEKIAEHKDNLNKLKVYDDGTWYERSSGLPKDMYIKAVAISSKNNNTAYALMSGPGSAADKIFKTTDRGKNWKNITGNLPDVQETRCKKRY